MAGTYQRNDSSIELAPYRDSDDLSVHSIPFEEEKKPLKARRGRPWLKYGLIAFVILFFGTLATSVSNSTVRAKAAGYINHVRPGTFPQDEAASAHDTVEVMDPSSDPATGELTPSLEHDIEDPSGGGHLSYPSDGSSSVAEPSASSGDKLGDHTLDVSGLEPHHSCEFVTQTTIAELQQVKEPTIRVMSGDKAVSSADILTAPVSLCVLVAIPQTQLPENEYGDAPVPGKGPDSIHLLLNSTDVVLTFPPLLPLQGQPEIEKLRTEKPIIYKADTVLYTAGTYRVTANHDFDHWRWSQEWWRVGPGFGTYYTRTGNMPEDIFMSHVWQERPLPATSITVKGTMDMPERPPCSDKINAGVGRWYKQESFSSLHHELADEWGYVWDGDYCRLSYYSPRDTVDCFADKKIQFFGDSMIRRLAKTVIAGGEWCRILDHKCQDADDDDKGQVRKVDYIPETDELNFTSFPRGMHFQSLNPSPIEFGKSSTAYFSFLTALTNNSGTWMDRLYPKEDLKVLKEWGGVENDETNDRMILPGRFDHARPPPESGDVDLVVVGFGAWDQAFTNWYDPYEARIQEFRDALVKAYSKPTSAKDIPIILRLTNSWCCRNTESAFRRYTGARICEFDARTRRVFDVDSISGSALDGRMLTVQPTMMNGRPDIVRDFGGSNANHPRASFVRLEMQMLMNSVCARDPVTGTPSLRQPSR